MRLNKNIPIIIIVLTLITFVSLHISSNKEIPYIETISGDIEELDNINLIASEWDKSYYKEYEYILHKNNIQKNEYSKSKLLKNIDMLDVSSGVDNISHIGFEVSEGIQNFVIDVSTGKEESNRILDSQGKDNIIWDYKMNSKEIDRSKYEIENPTDIYLRAISSYRYKSELYVLIEDGDYNLHIIKINPNDLKINHVESINLVDYISNIKSMSYSIQNIKSKDNKFYISIYDVEDANVETKQEYIYLMSYDIETNEKNTLKMSIDDDMSEYNVMANEDYIDVFYMNENMEFYVQKIDKNTNNTLEKNKVDINIDVQYLNLMSDESKVYICNTIDDYKTNKSYFDILVFDKNKNEVTYEGEISGLSKFDVDIQKR